MLSFKFHYVLTFSIFLTLSQDISDAAPNKRVFVMASSEIIQGLSVLVRETRALLSCCPLEVRPY